MKAEKGTTYMLQSHDLLVLSTALIKLEELIRGLELLGGSMREKGSRSNGNQRGDLHVDCRLV
jgi:hypothetical protein